MNHPITASISENKSRCLFQGLILGEGEEHFLTVLDTNKDFPALMLRHGSFSKFYREKLWKALTTKAIDNALRPKVTHFCAAKALRG